MAATRSQRIQEHQIWTDLEDLDQLLVDAESLLADHDPEAISAQGSLLALATHTRGVLKSINPVLVPENQREIVNRSIVAISNSVRAGIDQEDPTQLVTAWSQADQLLTAVATLPVVKSRHDMTGMTEAISHFHQHLNQLLVELQTRANTMHDEIEELDERRNEIATDISAQKDALATAISGFENQIATAISKFQEQIAAEQQKQAAEYDAAFEAAQAKLDAANKQGEDVYEQDESRHLDQIKRFDTEFEALRTEIDTAAKETAANNAAQAAEMIADLQEHLEKAKSLVEMIGEVTMTGHYQRNALEQKKAADTWRLATVVASILAVASAALLAWHGLFHRADRDWIDYISRFGVTIALAALATYLGAQSLRHRKREISYRSLELELATLDPFLSSIPDEERHRIKAHLSMRYFVGTNPAAARFVEPVESQGDD